MNDYMKALHQRFFREPECADVREEIKDLRQELRETLQKPERRKLTAAGGCTESAPGGNLPC